MVNGESITDYALNLEQDKKTNSKLSSYKNISVAWVM